MVCRVHQERQLACQCGHPRWDALEGFLLQFSELEPAFDTFS